MTACRTVDEVLAAADATDWPPLTQDQADYFAALLIADRADAQAA